MELHLVGGFSDDEYQSEKLSKELLGKITIALLECDIEQNMYYRVFQNDYCPAKVVSQTLDFRIMYNIRQNVEMCLNC